MRLLVYLSSVLLCAGACGTKPEPGSVRQQAKSEVNKRVELRATEEEAPEIQPEKPLPADELKKKLQGCFDAIVSQEAHEVRLCFTKDAKAMHADADRIYKGASDIVNTLYQPAWSAFPDLKGGAELVLMKGTDVAVMAWGKGTHTGNLSGLEPTDRVVATNSLKVLSLAHDGRINFEVSYSDPLRFRGQLGETNLPFREAFEKVPEEKGWFVASGNEVEQSNEKVVESFVAALANKEAARFANLMAKNVVLVDYALSEDLHGVGALQEEYGELIQAFSNLKVESMLRWAAGDYVLQLLTLKGKNDGAWPRYEWEPNKRKSKVNLGIVFYLRDGKIQKVWRYWDAQLALERIGFVQVKKP